ncbi:TPA: iron chelate uptake ABC transporter family permease subunit [Streptococcus agalactiae]
MIKDLEIPKLLILLILLITAIILFLIYGIPTDANEFLIIYILKTRYQKLIALILVGICIGSSSLIFQTLTNNRLLTPSIIGLDSLYVLIQTGLMYLIGAQRVIKFSSFSSFLLSLLLMVGFAYLLFTILFRNKKQSLYFVLLAGLIFNTLFSSISSFIQDIMDPNDFMILQNQLFASFNAINTKILWISFIIIVVSFAINWPFIKELDVLLLGKENAISLGIPYQKLTTRIFLWLALMVAIATALVGPITFLGLLVAHITYHSFHTFRHQILVPIAIVICIFTLVLGQHLVQNLLHLTVQLSVLLNLIGGSYFIFTLIKGRKNL